jgi:hypothetical protein
MIYLKSWIQICETARHDYFECPRRLSPVANIVTAIVEITLGGFALTQKREVSKKSKIKKINGGENVLIRL